MYKLMVNNYYILDVALMKTVVSGVLRWYLPVEIEILNKTKLIAWYDGYSV